jgi:hypothetical protein
MAALSTRVTVTFVTRFGFEARVVFYVPAGIVDPTDATITAIVAAIQALTAAYGLRIEVSAVAPHAATPTAASTYVNEDKAEFVFPGQGGVAHTFKVPALKASILESDNETIDATAGAAATFVAAVASGAQGIGGETLTAPTVGHRRAARKTLKK